MPNNFDKRYREIAERFLVSAVVVDDQPYHGGAEQVGPLRTPSRADQPVDDKNESGSRSGQSLDAGAITGSFSKYGLVCGVVKPAREGEVNAVAVKRADLVVIDWQLYNDDGKRALNLINSILEGDQGQRLRLIAVYTGQPDIARIGKRINEKLCNRYDLKNGTREHPVTLSCGHCRIVIYAKLGTQLNQELMNWAVSEVNLPDLLIDDFVRMTAGLVPSIALVALTAVRENPHQVLDKFDSKLDAAFLAHRACLPNPHDSEQHVVAQIASELRAIMEEKVGRKQPAGMEVIKSWIKEFKSKGNIEFEVGNVSQNYVINMLEEGVDKADIRIVSQPRAATGGGSAAEGTSGTTSQNELSNSKRKNAHTWLTAGFVRCGDGDPKDLDSRLAWMTCFRAIDPPDKKLWLGTAVRRCGYPDCMELLLCMRPRCDSVRMKGAESFLFLPLLISPKPGKFQLVVRSSASDPKYCRVSVDTDMSRWKMIEFEPDPTAKAVVARKKNGSAGYVFTDVGCNRYEWIGELKTEVAHSVGQILSATLSRIALDKSEWLRRSERSG